MELEKKGDVDVRGDLAIEIASGNACRLC